MSVSRDGRDRPEFSAVLAVRAIWEDYATWVAFHRPDCYCLAPETLLDRRTAPSHRLVIGQNLHRNALAGAASTMHRTKDLRIRSANAIWLAVLSVPVCGCNSMTSQAINAEGVRLYQNGSYQQAAAQFERAIACNPRSATAYYNLASALHKNGKLYNRQQDLEQAEQLYNQCLDYDPNHTECYRGLAVLLTETERQDAAFRLLEGWAARSPHLADPRIELARLLEESNNLPQASAQLEEAVAIEPHNSRALTALGRIREASGDTTQALANYQRSLAINRFQPAVEARVASLQAAQAASAPMVAPPDATRTVQDWQSSVRY